MPSSDSFITSTQAVRNLLQGLDEAVLQKARNENPYFTETFVRYAIKAITEDLLDPVKLNAWLERHAVPVHQPKKVGLILAGNIPLVGFHDLLCVMAAGHRPVVRLSHKDSVLMKWLLERWNPPMGDSVIQIAEQLTDVDAVIATGSDNSSRYFEYYYGSKPHIFRKNRNGVAVLSGNESPEEMKGLADDVFLYFGLGCRNVSKVYLPKGYDPGILMEALSQEAPVVSCTSYANSLNYQRAVLHVNSEPYLTNQNVILRESPQFTSPVGVLHYEFYSDLNKLKFVLGEQAQKIQCIVTSLDTSNAIPFGTSQQPSLSNYPDNVDVMRFLLSL